MIAAYPALLDGIVVADNDFDSARELLAGAGPAAAIVVSAGSLLASTQAPGSSADGAAEGGAAARAWVVPPDPTLFDPAGADAALETRQAKLAGVAQRIGAADAAERNATVFASALGTHLEHWPSGALGAARRQPRPPKLTRRSPKSGLGWPRANTPRPLSRPKQPREAVNVAQEAKAKAGQLVTVIENLERQTRQAAQAGREAEQLRQVEVEAEAEARAADLERARAQESAAEHRQHAQRAEQAIVALSQTLADLPDPGESPTAAPSEEQMAESLTELRSRFAEAERLLTSAISESEVAQRLAHVEAELSGLGQHIDALESDVREAALALAATAQATNESARSAAERDARGVRDTALQRTLRSRATCSWHAEIANV